MSSILSLGILLATVALSLWQPNVGRFRCGPHVSAALGAGMALALGLVGLDQAVDILRFLAEPVGTLIGLMAVTLIASRVRLFELWTRGLGRAARGDPRRLLLLLFVTGTAMGTFFTNDAAILILTPIVFQLVEEIGESWSHEQKEPFYFVVLYVANLVGFFVISNPINLVITSYLGISFGYYAAWMALPALASAATTFVGLRLYFRRDLPERAGLPEKRPIVAELSRFRRVAVVVILVAVAAFVTKPLTGIPVVATALCAGALLAVLFWLLLREPVLPVARGIAWDVVVFVAGIFVIATAVGNSGALDWLAGLLLDGDRVGREVGLASTSIFSATSSALMNNHPTANTMAVLIHDLPLAESVRHQYAFAALIGGDLGPKMLPIGSLAALLWFRLLRDRGVVISPWKYVRIGVPVTLAAIATATLTLIAEVHLWAWLR